MSLPGDEMLIPALPLALGKHRVFKVGGMVSADSHGHPTKRGRIMENERC